MGLQTVYAISSHDGSRRAPHNEAVVRCSNRCWSVCLSSNYNSTIIATELIRNMFAICIYFKSTYFPPLFLHFEEKFSSAFFFFEAQNPSRWTDYHSEAIYSPPAPGLHSGPVFSVLPAKLIISCHSPAAAPIQTPFWNCAAKRTTTGRKML